MAAFSVKTELEGEKNKKVKVRVTSPSFGDTDVTFVPERKAVSLTNSSLAAIRESRV